MRAWPHPQVLIPLITLALAHFLSQLPIGARAYSVDRRTPLPELYHPLLIARDEDGHGHGHSHSDESTAKSATLHGDSHSHGHGHGKPLLEINETMISMYHKPTPPSYGTHDFDDPNASPKHPGMMGLHALLMSLAFFVALPIGMWIAEPHYMCRICADGAPFLRYRVTVDRARSARSERCGVLRTGCTRVVIKRALQEKHAKHVSVFLHRELRLGLVDVIAYSGIFAIF